MCDTTAHTVFVLPLHITPEQEIERTHTNKTPWQFGAEFGLVSPIGIAIDRGSIFVSSAEMSRVFVFAFH